MPSTVPTNAGNESTIAAWLNQFLTAAGFRGQQLAAAEAGFLGNFQIESSFNPGAYNPVEHAHGIAQWEGGRFTAGLAPYAAQHGLSTDSLQADLGYLGQELSGPYSGVLAAMRGVTDPTQDAQIVQSQFEGSTPDSLGARQNAAQQAYAWLGGKGGPFAGGAATGPPGDAGGAAQPPPLPYALGSLSGNLTGAQRTGIINWLEAVGNSPAAIAKWLESNVGGVGNVAAGMFGDPTKVLAGYEASGAKGNAYDQYLEDAYNAIGKGGGIGYGAGHLSYSWHVPGSGVINGIVGDAERAAESVIGWIAAPIVKFLIAAALVIVGAIAVYLAVKMLAEGGDDTSPTIAPSASTTTDDKEAETPKSSEGGGEASIAEDAGEAAAA